VAELKEKAGWGRAIFLINLDDRGETKLKTMQVCQRRMDNPVVSPSEKESLSAFHNDIVRRTDI